MVVGQGVVQQHGHGLGRGQARKSRGDRLASELHPHPAHRHIANLAVDACNVDVDPPPPLLGNEADDTGINLPRPSEHEISVLR